jgi:hypothetical protein
MGRVDLELVARGQGARRQPSDPQEDQEEPAAEIGVAGLDQDSSGCGVRTRKAGTRDHLSTQGTPGRQRGGLLLGCQPRSRLGLPIRR